jgi:hypothetical protein
MPAPCVHTIRALGGHAHVVEAHRHVPRLCTELQEAAYRHRSYNSHAMFLGSGHLAYFRLLGKKRLDNLRLLCGQ